MNFWTQPFSHYLGVNFISKHTFADGLKRKGNLKVLRRNSILKEWGTSIFNSVCECVNQALKYYVQRANVPILQVRSRAAGFKWFLQYFRKSDKAKNGINSVVPLAKNFQGVLLGWHLHYSISKPEAVWVRFIRSAVVICSLTWLFAPVFQKCISSSLRQKNADLVENW